MAALRKRRHRLWRGRADPKEAWLEGDAAATTSPNRVPPLLLAPLPSPRRSTPAASPRLLWEMNPEWGVASLYTARSSAPTSARYLNAAVAAAVTSTGAILLAAAVAASELGCGALGPVFAVIQPAPSLSPSMVWVDGGPTRDARRLPCLRYDRYARREQMRVDGVFHDSAAAATMAAWQAVLRRASERGLSPPLLLLLAPPHLAGSADSGIDTWGAASSWDALAAAAVGVGRTLLGASQKAVVDAVTMSGCQETHEALAFTAATAEEAVQQLRRHCTKRRPDLADPGCHAVVRLVAADGTTVAGICLLSGSGVPALATVRHRALLCLSRAGQGSTTAAGLACAGSGHGVSQALRHFVSAACVGAVLFVPTVAEDARRVGLSLLSIAADDTLRLPVEKPTPDVFLAGRIAARLYRWAVVTRRLTLRVCKEPAPTHVVDEQTIGFAVELVYGSGAPLTRPVDFECWAVLRPVGTAADADGACSGQTTATFDEGVAEFGGLSVATDGIYRFDLTCTVSWPDPVSRTPVPAPIFCSTEEFAVASDPSAAAALRRHCWLGKGPTGLPPNTLRLRVTVAENDTSEVVSKPALRVFIQTLARATHGVVPIRGIARVEFRPVLRPVTVEDAGSVCNSPRSVVSHRSRASNRSRGSRSPTQRTSRCRKSRISAVSGAHSKYSHVTSASPLSEVSSYASTTARAAAAAVSLFGTKEAAAAVPIRGGEGRGTVTLPYSGRWQAHITLSSGCMRRDPGTTVGSVVTLSVPTPTPMLVAILCNEEYRSRVQSAEQAARDFVGLTRLRGAAVFRLSYRRLRRQTIAAAETRQRMVMAEGAQRGHIAAEAVYTYERLRFECAWWGRAVAGQEDPDSLALQVARQPLELFMQEPFEVACRLTLPGHLGKNVALHPPRTEAVALTIGRGSTEGMHLSVADPYRDFYEDPTEATWTDLAFLKAGTAYMELVYQSPCPGPYVLATTRPVRVRHRASTVEVVREGAASVVRHGETIPVRLAVKDANGDVCADLPESVSVRMVLKSHGDDEEIVLPAGDTVQRVPAGIGSATLSAACLQGVPTGAYQLRAVLVGVQYPVAAQRKGRGSPRARRRQQALQAQKPIDGFSDVFTVRPPKAPWGH
eukprot:TRINITY_DN21225_c0_g1_i3.p1 TRINITY_DN21225_c0_g1~~TRINITY_DN21225_c0_g1_i3.p1  ORF type:complete len:1122 (+),score=274.68 TRINITY_DN21225_c0_g1_i3:35-3400(+)